jgi:plastocyanin
MYQWWVLLHLVGVFTFLLSHGVSVGVLFRLRKERQPAKVATLLELSGTSVRGFYVGLVILLVGGFAAVASGHLWGQAWIWVSVGVLVLASVAMTSMATPYYRRVGFVARAMEGGTEAVTPEQFDEVLKDSRSGTVAGIGFVALALILYMMVMKPTFGLGSSTAAAPPPSGCTPASTVHVQASGLKFNAACLAAPANTPFKIVFDNQDTDQHNVAIYNGSSPLFTGTVFGGPNTMTYSVPALPAGTYKFQCDVHPFMNGTFKVEAGGASTSGPSPPANTGATTGASGS